MREKERERRLKNRGKWSKKTTRKNGWRRRQATTHFILWLIFRGIGGWKCQQEPTRRRHQRREKKKKKKKEKKNVGNFYNFIRPRESSSCETWDSTFDCSCNYNMGSTRPSSGRTMPLRAPSNGASNDTISSISSTCICPLEDPCFCSWTPGRACGQARNNSLPRTTRSTSPNETASFRLWPRARIFDSPPTGSAHLKHNIRFVIGRMCSRRKIPSAILVSLTSPGYNDNLK